MITTAQMRAARALAGIDQRELAEKSGLSVPIICRANGEGSADIDTTTLMFAISQSS
jgi:transcriptional regulator with XRE-family HTH domain